MDRNFNAVHVPEVKDDGISIQILKLFQALRNRIAIILTDVTINGNHRDIFLRNNPVIHGMYFLTNLFMVGKKIGKKLFCP